MKNNTILLTAEPKGRMVEGIIKSGESPKPGQIVQIDPSVALQGGRHTLKIFNRDADGDHPAGEHLVLLEDRYQGRSYDTAYAEGERCFAYAPLPGDELNLLLKDISGTGDDHTAGEILMVDDDTGKLIATTGTPECEVALLLETVTDPTSDTLAWCRWTGH